MTKAMAEEHTSRVAPRALTWDQHAEPSFMDPFSIRSAERRQVARQGARASCSSGMQECACEKAEGKEE